MLPSVVVCGKGICMRGRLTSTINIVLLFEMGVTIALCQLAFLPIALPGTDVRFHSFLLLLPFVAAAPYVSLPAYMGAAALVGALVSLRIQFMPMDYYELTFSTPFGAILTVCVFVLVLWACRRVVDRLAKGGWPSLALSLLAASFVISASWLAYLNAVFGAYGYGDYVAQLAGTWWSAEFWGQVVFDGLTWFAASLFVQALTERIERDTVPELATVFKRWLFLVVTGAFLLTTTVSFLFSTVQALREAEGSLEGQVSYVFALIDDRVREHGGEGIGAIARSYAGGYGETIVVVRDGKVVSTNNGAYVQTFSGKENLDGIALRDMSFVQDGVTMGITYLYRDRSGAYDVIALATSERVFAGRTSVIALNTMCYLVLFGAVFVLVSKLLNNVVVVGFLRTNDILAKICAGDLEQRVEESETKEFSELSEHINTTVDALKELIGEAERRMEYDLATARAIQEGALPRTFPAFPEIDAFDIFAAMDAAKEVGGDFFDFFLAGNHTLGFLIADVSGKGIPGALFMMAAKAEIEHRMLEGLDLARAVTGANEYLYANNDADMFVTVWAATLDFETGIVTYVNAGHNFPLQYHAKDSSWEWIKKTCGMFVGTFDLIQYHTETVVLEPGDKLVLYTDGVNEAFSANGEEYGNARLEAFLVGHSDRTPKELTEGLRADVAAWARGAEQSDDITILVLEYKGA